LVAEAVRLGGKVVNDGGATVRGTFFYPAVVFPTNPASRLYREEQFGPVVPVLAFDSVEEPIRYVAESNYGQQLSLFGTDAAVLARLIDPMVNQVCRLNINSQCQRGPDAFPFTGRKDSAEGTLSVSDALRVFTIRTLVAAKANEVNKAIITRTVRDRLSNFLSTDFIL
jgi:glyceraldehyde-3-phosphate dehydrogenase (NADP+)